MASTPDIPDAVVSMVEEFEGFRSCPYLCPAHVWTIGFGTTIDIAGKPVCAKTKCITEDQARLMARRDLVTAAKEVAGDVKVPLTENQKAALEDFTYNLGTGAFRTSTLLRKLNLKDYSGAAAELDKWDHAAGVVLAGLLRRRQAETDLFNKENT